MLGRGLSTKGHGHKKAASVSTRPSTSADTPLPGEAKQQAQAAALYAFARGTERNSADMGFDKSTSSAYTAPSSRPKGNENRHLRSASAGAVMSPSSLKKRRSVRFVGNQAKPLAPKITQNVVAKSPSTSTLRPRAIAADSSVAAAYRPPSRCRSLGKVPASPGMDAEGYRRSVQAYDEYYTREEDLISNLSSYKKIRRTKSQLHSAQNPGVVFTTETPETSPAKSWAATASKGLRAPKSMSFLQNRPKRDSNGGYDVAVQEARDKFLQQVEQQRLKSQPSFLFRNANAKQTANKRQDREFRRSLRRPSSSTNSYGMPIASAGQGPLAPQHTGSSSLRSKARAASKSIKNKLKGLFKRAGSEPGLPEQEVQATRSHVTDYQVLIGPPSSIHDGYNNVPRPADDPYLAQVAYNHPSLHPVPSHQQLRSLAGSMQSLRSEFGRSEVSSAQSSRLPSWTTQGSVETTAVTREARERERQRLSVINEVGTHVPASSFQRGPVSGAFSPYPEFNFPGGMPSQDVDIYAQSSYEPGHSYGQDPSYGIGQALVSPTTQMKVDSARIYSALMKRLDETSPKAKLQQMQDHRQRLRFDSSEPPTPIPPRRSSIGGTPASIRSVPHSGEAALEVHDSPGTAHVSDFAPPLPMAVTGNDTGSFSYKAKSNQSSRIRSTSESTVITNHRTPNYRAFPPPVMGGIPSALHTPVVKGGVTLSFTPQEMADNIETVEQEKAKGLRETRSTFFGTSDIRSVRSVTSPWRRAVKAEREGERGSPLGGSGDEAGSSEEEEAGEKEVMETPKKTKGKRGTGASTDGSDYSRTTSGQTPPFPAEEEEGEIKDYTPGKHGSVVLLDHTTYRYSDSKTRHRASHSASSQDWKTWMSGQVSSLSSEDPYPIADALPLASIDEPVYVVPHVVPKRSMKELQTRASTATLRPAPEVPKWDTQLVERASRHVREDQEINGDDVVIGTPGTASLLAARRRKAQMAELATHAVTGAADVNGGQALPRPILKKAAMGSEGSSMTVRHVVEKFPEPPSRDLPVPPTTTLMSGGGERPQTRNGSASGAALKVSFSTLRGRGDAKQYIESSSAVLGERVPSASDTSRTSSGATQSAAASNSASLGLARKESKTTIRAVGSFDTAVRNLIASTSVGNPSPTPLPTTPTSTSLLSAAGEKRERAKLVRKSGRRVSSASIGKGGPSTPGNTDWIATPSPGLMSAVEKQWGGVTVTATGERPISSAGRPMSRSSIPRPSSGVGRPGSASYGRPGSASYARPGSAGYGSGRLGTGDGSRPGTAGSEGATVKWPGQVRQTPSGRDLRSVAGNGVRMPSSASAGTGMGKENSAPSSKSVEGKALGMSAKFGFGMTATAEVKEKGKNAQKEREKVAAAQAVGSKRMVDMFLSSRRKRMAGSEDSGAVGGGRAFI